MPAGPPTRPRKAAVQMRSRATVEALIEATARILVRDGFDRASTNRIAVEAGVSIGSLYQYYPSKEALVAALIARHNRDLMGVVRGAVEAVDSAPIEVGMRRMVEAAIAAHRMDPDLHRVLAEQIPRIGALEEVEAFNREYFALFVAYLDRHRAELRPADLDLAAFLCVTAIEAVTHTAVLHRGELIADAAVGALVEETTRLVLGYLR